MGKLLKNNSKDIVKIVFAIVLLSIVSVLLSGWMGTDAVRSKIEGAGIWAPILVFLYIVASHVFAPLAGTPAVVIALSAFSFRTAFLCLYTASIVSATINFYIARRLGRVWVVKLAGKDSIAKIDQFVEIMGAKLLIIARLFGFPFYEFISYAVGFTKMSFLSYIVITATVMPIAGVGFSYFIYNSLASVKQLSVVFVGMFVIGALFSWYTVHEYIKLQNNKKMS